MLNIRNAALLLLVVISIEDPALAQEARNGGFATLVETISPLDVINKRQVIVGHEATSLIGIQPQAAAPQLSREIIYAVGSTQYYNVTGNFWEYMTQIGQQSTTADHGGQQLRVVVQEIGYGGTPTARLNGTILPRSADYMDTNICIVGSRYVSPCPAGSTVVGYYHYFNLDGYQSGTFSYQNSSLNPPYTTLSTSINIQ